MNQKSLKTLEYEKIISQLTEYAASIPGKLLCQELKPSSDYEEILQAQAETSDAVSRIRMKGSLSPDRCAGYPGFFKASGNRQYT